MVIGWMRELMEQGLGWKDEVQFVCCAFTNAAANLIGGSTLHSYFKIHRAGTGTQDAGKLSDKIKALRVLIIDEISMVSAELLGLVNALLMQHMPEPRTYKLRKRHATDPARMRAFGGVNLIMLGDFWQIPPIRQTSLASNPAVQIGQCADALRIFWSAGPNVVRRLWEFSVPMRCVDAWYNEVLQECRRGALSHENYAYLHGLPTLTSPGIACTCNADIVDDKVLGRMRRAWQQYFVEGGGDMAAYQAGTAAECVECRTERHQRQRVLADPTQIPDEFRNAPFDDAVAIYGYNRPRFFSTFIRAREFAKKKNVQLSWLNAVDVPSDEIMGSKTAEQVEKLRLQWLRYHDQQTECLPSKYALAVGMPVKLTYAVDPERKLCKGSIGKIYGWTLDPECNAEEIVGQGQALHGRGEATRPARCRERKAYPE